MKKIVLRNVANLVLLAFLVGSLVSFWRAYNPYLPSLEDPIVFYSNQLRDDLCKIFSKAISKAERSITFIIFTMTDFEILNALKRKSLENVSVTIFCDAKHSSSLYKNLPKNMQIYSINEAGLMHQKILIIDEKMAFLGSSNMTTESLRMHGNIVSGIFSETLAKELSTYAKKLKNENNCRSGQGHRIFSIGNQSMELFTLPENISAIDKVVELIENATKSLCINMFAWTNKILAKAVVNAHKRGVRVQVVIDKNCGKGMGKGVVSELASEGIDVRLSTDIGLLHYKIALIDDDTLIFGSTNWTKAAFGKNRELLAILYGLTSSQKKQMNEIFAINKCLGESPNL